MAVYRQGLYTSEAEMYYQLGVPVLQKANPSLDSRFNVQAVHKHKTHTTGDAEIGLYVRRRGLFKSASWGLVLLERGLTPQGDGLFGMPEMTGRRLERSNVR
jgi:hypothetical protein